MLTQNPLSIFFNIKYLAPAKIGRIIPHLCYSTIFLLLSMFLSINFVYIGSKIMSQAIIFALYVNKKKYCKLDIHSRNKF